MNSKAHEFIKKREAEIRRIDKILAGDAIKYIAALEIENKTAIMGDSITEPGALAIAEYVMSAYVTARPHEEILIGPWDGTDIKGVSFMDKRATEIAKSVSNDDITVSMYIFFEKEMILKTYATPGTIDQLRVLKTIIKTDVLRGMSGPIEAAAFVLDKNQVTG